MTTAAIIIIAYLLALTGLGVWHTRRVKTGDDFALAGRRLGVTVTTGTLIATWMGTGSLFGSPEFTINHGVAAFLYPVGGVLGIVLLGLLCGRARALPAKSLPEILKIRFGRAAQVIGALALIGAYMIIVSYQYRAGAHVSKQLFPGAPEGLLPIAFAVFIVLYTALAGMISVAWTDLINGAVMTVGILAALAWVYLQWDPASQPLPETMKDPTGGESTVIWIGYLLPAFLLVMGDANLFQRFMSTGSPKTARRSAVGMFWGVLVLEYAIIALALIGWLIMDDKPANPAHTIVNMAATTLPPWLGVLILASATAVIITTADSILLTASTSVAVDFGGGLNTPGRQRVIVVVLGLVALGLAYASEEFFSVALYAYTLYGATLTPAVVCALAFPRVPRAGVVGGMAAGLGVALVWKGLLAGAWLPEALGDWAPVLPALAANVLIIAIACLVLPPQDTADGVTAP